MIKLDDIFKLGRFYTPHGICGEINFSFTDDIFDRTESPYWVVEIDGIFVPFFVESYRFRGETTALVKIEDINDEQAAKLLGKRQSAIANTVRLLRHSPQVLQALREGKLTERHGRALLKLSTEEEKLAAIEEIVRQGMNVARTEKYIQELLEGRQKGTRRVNVGSFLNNLNQSLAKIQLSGISAVSERRETEDRIVLTITIPK